MTENMMPTNIGPQIEPTNADQADRQAQQIYAGPMDSRLELSQRGPLTKPPAPGRMPLFRR